MITEKRWLLIASDDRTLEYLRNFEGIKEVKKAQDIEKIWAYNKTPVSEKPIRGYDKLTLKVPDFKDDFIKNFTLWAYSKGFECGEYRTGEVYDTREEPCILCSIANHKGLNRQTLVYNKVVDKEVDCIIYESPRFFVTSELGALKPGYLMIIPKEHDFLSMAQLPSLYRREFDEVCKDVEAILKGAFGDKPVAFLEHGSGPSGLTSHKKSIVHAHTHVVIDFELKKKYLNMVQMKQISDLSKARFTHYFAYKVGSDSEWLCCYDDEVYIQRQFPRQVMAKEMGYTPSLYNWRKYDFSENVHTTLYFLYKYLVDRKNQSERIRERTFGFVEGYKLRRDFEE